MKLLARILSLILFATTYTSAMRADDLSELVATVAGSPGKSSAEADSRKVQFYSLPRYEPSSKPKDSKSDILDGIYNAMTIQASLDFILNAVDYHEAHVNLLSPELEYWASSPSLAKEGFFRPVPGRITSRFGWRAQFNRLHHGVDLSLNIGDTVRAALSGTVERIAYDYDGYGNYVVIRHPDGMETLYGHLQYALVSQGQYVAMGYPIGIGGNTGNSTGPHLHFEARLDGIAVDPTLIFDFYGQFRFASKSHVIDNSASASQSSKSLTSKRTYIVKHGDTPKSIARRAGITVARLCQLNMLKESDALQLGRMLKLR